MTLQVPVPSPINPINKFLQNASYAFCQLLICRPSFGTCCVVDSPWYTEESKAQEVQKVRERDVAIYLSLYLALCLYLISVISISSSIIYICISHKRWWNHKILWQKGSLRAYVHFLIFQTRRTSQGCRACLINTYSVGNYTSPGAYYAPSLSASL